MSIIESHTAYVSVPVDEIAFAIAIFVNAANRAISPAHVSPLSPRARRACDQALLDLVPRSAIPVESAASVEAPLHEAFRILWGQFEGHPQQSSVCARILVFHLLMERTKGAILEEWLKEDPATPETVVLDDAIVAAIATIPLPADGSLLESEFVSAVRNLVQKRSETAHPALMAETRDIASQLLALEAQTAATEKGDLAVAFKVSQKLHLCLVAVVGREAYRTLLARALALAIKEEPSLAAIRVRQDGTLEGADAESSQAGKVLIARFLQLQTTFIGEALVYNLLRELWPGLSRYQGTGNSAPS